MKDTAELRVFAEKLKEGYQLMDEGRYKEAKNNFEPFVELMRQNESPQIRLFYTYSLAQFRTGDVEGFLETYNEIKKVEPASAEEEKMKHDLDTFFFEVMSELGRSEH